MSYYKQVRTQKLESPSPSPTMETSSLESIAPSLFDKFQLTQWIDKLGGIDGILNRIQQMQRVIHTFQQFAPLLKSFKMLRSNATTDDDQQEFNSDEFSPKKRQKKRKKNASSTRRRRRY
jgi:hypothetical protein